MDKKRTVKITTQVKIDDKDIQEIFRKALNLKGKITYEINEIGGDYEPYKRVGMTVTSVETDEGS